VLSYSPHTLSRAMHETAGRSTKQFIGDRVLLEAKRLLAHTDMTAPNAPGGQDPTARRTWCTSDRRPDGRCWPARTRARRACPSQAVCTSCGPAGVLPVWSPATGWSYRGRLREESHAAQHPASTPGLITAQWCWRQRMGPGMRGRPGRWAMTGP